MAGLTATALGPPSGFNWVYLVELLICGILSLFFLFYFNRLFATVISYAVRAWTWHKYRAYVDITSLQISPLGGRIFFKSIRYHAHNITVLVHDGNITWRYWLRQVQDAQIYDDVKEKQTSVEESDRSEDGGEKAEAGKQRRELPCRISVRVSGVEAFIYNRSPVYDGIVEATIKKAEQLAKGREHDAADASELDKPVTERNDLDPMETRSVTKAEGALDIPFYLRVLPIQISCKRAAAAIGNENTTSVITATVEQSSGRIDASAAKLDLFKLLFGFEFKKVVVQMKQNNDYKQSQASAAHKALRRADDAKGAPKRRITRLANTIVQRLRSLLTRPSKSSVRNASINSDTNRSQNTLHKPVPGEAQWHGLSRYLTQDSSGSHPEWQSVEYAKATTLADCEQVDMRFYWDISRQTGKDEVEQLLPHDSPPEYGIDLAVHGGTVTYGPWADRQRINLQHVFFPASYVDATPLSPLKAGEPRLATIFKLFLSIEKDVTLRIPTRETSKDHLWKRQAEPAQPELRKRSGRRRNEKKRAKTSPENADARPYGWIDITVKPNTTVNYTMDMYARDSGYRNTIDLDAKGTEIVTSVNHALLWRSGDISLFGDLSNPISWSKLRNWPFKIKCEDLELFILRDHMFLIIDLVNDWGSGSVPEFYTFIPFRYDMDMTFTNFKLFLNTNDANIINSPSDFDKNDFVTLEGDVLDAKLGIPMQHYRPQKNEITFDVLTKHLSMRILSSSRTTTNTLLTDKRVATLHKLTLTGSFSSNQEQADNLTDVLRMDIVGYDFSLQAYGFLLRHLINVKENYFGDYLHFKTLEEFQNASGNMQEAHEITASLPKPQTSNELDVILSIVVKEAAVMLPTNLYSAQKFIKAELPEASVDLRVTSYYLDLQIDLAPVGVRNGTNDGAEALSNTQLFVSHTNVVGHRLFGLPPNEPAYVSTWDIDVGHISGELHNRFLHDIVLAAKSLIFTFKDLENALPLNTPLDIFDISFVQVQTADIKVWLHAGTEALLFSAEPVMVHVNDWANEHFSQTINVIAPSLTVACIDRAISARHTYQRSHQEAAMTYALLQTTLVLDVVGRKRYFVDEALKQQAFLRQQDVRTNRAAFLQRAGQFWTQAGRNGNDVQDHKPPEMPYPSLPGPVDDNGAVTLRAGSVKSVAYTEIKEQPSAKSISSLHASHPAGQQTESSRPERYDAPPAALVTSSSTYARPMFPLDVLHYDPAVLPAPGLRGSSKSRDSMASFSSTDLNVTSQMDGVEQITVMVDLPCGVQAYAEPKMANVVSNLIDTLQASAVEEVMDAFQISIMSEVGDKLQEQHIQPSALQLAINLPSLDLRVLNPVNVDIPPDVVDISAQALRFMLRSRKASDRNHDSLSVHSKLDVLRISAKEGIASPSAVSIALGDLVVWLATSSSIATRVIANNTTIEIAAASAPYLVGAAERLKPMVESTIEEFKQLQSLEQARLRLLLYQLTQFGEHVSDPTFLTMMTYILRAFPTHYRNQESWKVLMRFRSILQSLPEGILNDLQNTFASKEVACPEDAPQKMLESWTQWRNWDVINVGRTTVFQSILGITEDNIRDQRVKAKAASITFVQDKLRIAITDMHNDSSLTMQETSFGMQIIPPAQPEGLMLIDENERSRTMAHVHTSSVSVELHWHLFELVNKLLPRILTSFPITAEEIATDSNKNVSATDSFTRSDVHLALSADTGSVSIRTINLHHLAQAEGLKLSVIGTTQADAPYGACVSGLLNADRAATQLHSKSRMIWQSLLVLPSVYADNLHYVPESGLPPSINAAIAYRDLEFSVEEQFPGILNLVDDIINSEVVQILRLVEAMSGSSNEQDLTLQPMRTAATTNLKSTKFSLALLAGELVVEVALLQSLKYRLDGRAASVRVVPSMNIDQQLTVDVDTGKLKHSLVNISHGEEHRQQIVDVPPINAHVVMHTTKEMQTVTVQSTVGLLNIDAEAIQSVMTTINKPEVKSFMKVIGDGIDELQHTVEHLNAGHQSFETKKAAADSVLQYRVALALAGIKVAASTAQTTAANSTAEFEIGVGECHAVISNAASIGQQEATLFPEVHGSLHGIGARLLVRDRRVIYPAGNVTFGLDFDLNVSKDENQRMAREFILHSSSFEVQAFPETAAITVDIVNQLQDRLKQLDLSQEIDYLNNLRIKHAQEQQPARRPSTVSTTVDASEQWTNELLAMRIVVKLNKIQMTWMVNSDASRGDTRAEDLVLSLKLIELNTHGGKEGRLTMRDLQVQLVPRGDDKLKRTMNSAILPEIAFSLAYWSEHGSKHLAFHASGKPLDLRLNSRFVIPVNEAQRSFKYAVDKFKVGTAAWQAMPTASGMPRGEMFSKLHIASLVAEVDFAGAQVHLEGEPRDRDDQRDDGKQRGRYGQFGNTQGMAETTLRSPGIALKLQYDNRLPQSSVKGEMMVAPSSNMLLPHVVPLILDISKSITEVMKQDSGTPQTPSVTKELEESSSMALMNESFISAEPSAIFGKTQVNLNLRVARQEFGFTCQPIAKVDAKAEMDDFYLTLSTIESEDLGHFFAITAKLSQLGVKVQHQYSREPTFSFEVSSIVLSLMNSKHFSGVNGISGILKVNPTKVSINGKQLQDLLLFREIWLPPEIRTAASTTVTAPSSSSEDHIMRKYQSMANAAAFPWNASICFEELGVELDLGQALGKSTFSIKNLWASSQKSSDWEQSLCIGLSEVSMISKGRMSGHIILSNLGVRTLIRWPESQNQIKQRPHIQASVGFSRIRTKAAFDYQAFAFADIEGLEFLMYNANDKQSHDDRLVAMLDCSKVYVFITSTSPSQAFALYQAVDRLILEKQTAFIQSLKDIEKHIRRGSTTTTIQDEKAASHNSSPIDRLLDLAPISLRTNVVVSLGNISVGAFPGTFFDSQILKLEANNLQARFGASLEDGKIKSGLGMTIGQLQVALAAVKKVPMPKSISDIEVDEIIIGAVGAKGGTILRVPRVIASMTTWQRPDNTQIEYIFKSLFEGKVDIGWNLNRINFIRGMWNTQSRALAARLGKPLPDSAVRITAAPNPDTENAGPKEKITAEVNLPQSKYEYIALTPPIVETPQLRDMGEATPPLEWIGLHRDRLPNITHQIIIVSLLRVAKEVEDAYQRILGTS